MSTEGSRRIDAGEQRGGRSIRQALGGSRHGFASEHVLGGEGKGGRSRGYWTRWRAANRPPDDLGATSRAGMMHDKRTSANVGQF